MIPVTVLDIVVPDRKSEHRILVLTNESRRRLLAIWIGPYEADCIALKLQGKEVVRPMTFSFMAHLLEKAGTRIESVSVSALKNETFFATVQVHNAGETAAIDARPSDAIALALHTNSPIYVSAEVMDNAGQDIPDNMEIAAQGQGLNDVAGLDPEEKERRQQQREKWEKMTPEERSRENRKKLLAHLTESGSLRQSAAPTEE